jgi:uncharacterized membrane protein
MEAYLLDWISLLLRWTHVVVAMAWIGASFYFIWLDNSLQPAVRAEDAARGVSGELWAIHGGGIYHAQKYRLAPEVMPATLHWFKWEAYWTWMSGFSLLTLLYYVNAEAYLIDPAVMALSKWQAIGIGVGALLAGITIYEGLCRSPLGRHETVLAGVLGVLLAAAAWGLAHVFSGRGAFIHFGALLATIMAGNVANVIIPGQRALMRAIEEGRAPDPANAIRAKQRSVHNTYFTLPAIFTMISGHYAGIHGHRLAWIALVLIVVAGALIRVWFVQRHKGSASSVVLAAGLVALAAAAFLVAPNVAPQQGSRQVGFLHVQQVIVQRCVSCHADKPTQPGFAAAPKGVIFESREQIVRHAADIYRQSVSTRVMPLGNLTAMTDDERALIDVWFRTGAKSE